MNKQFAIVVPTDYGPMIVNRYDTWQTNALFKTHQALDHGEICLIAEILKRKAVPTTTTQPPSSVFIDVGGCFGTWSIALAPLCKEVHVFEPQRILYNMICGSVALNSFEHVYSHNVAIGLHGRIAVPQFDYGKQLSFGSIEFGEKQTEKLDQERGTETLEFVQCRPLDDFQFEHADAIKIDVEGMEFDAVHSAIWTICKHRPVLYVEILKSDAQRIMGVFDTLDYSFWEVGMNMLCVPTEFAPKVADITKQFKERSIVAA
jgi:FkbM family methyltransferase